MRAATVKSMPPVPPTSEDIEAGAATLRAVCERLPESESRAAALAHIMTVERWALRALEVSERGAVWRKGNDGSGLDA